MWIKNVNLYHTLTTSKDILICDTSCREKYVPHGQPSNTLKLSHLPM